MQPVDDFDEFASQYRDIHNKNMQLMGGDSYYFARAKVQYVKEHEEQLSLNILDIGCGDGVTAISMAELFPGCSITGIDVSAESIALANKKKIAGAVFSVYDGKNIPFSEGIFDLVFIAGVLHHVDTESQATIIKEAYRVLKNNGRIYIFEHNPLNPATQYLVKTCPFDKHVKLLKRKKVKRIVATFNFKNIQGRYITFFPRNKVFSVFHKAEKYMSWCPLGAQFYVRAIK